MNLLILNAGSSSIKYKVIQTVNNKQELLFSGLIEGIGEDSGFWHHTDQSKKSNPQSFKNHQQAFRALGLKLKEILKNHPLQGVGHRVVHGGNYYYEPTVINAEVLENIHKLAQLAPIHNPINALGIEFALEQFPHTVQVAVFDSGFHHTLPSHASQYAIDTAVATRYQIKRYGFHGINHEFVARTAAHYLNKPLEKCNFISLHLGNGASACLIKEGKSVDTSMGMTPLAGLVMGTRCGDIDPAIVFYLQQQGMSVQEVDTLLNKKSGLKGLAGDNDMRQLLTRAAINDQQAQLAIDIYVYAIQKIIGAYYSQLPQLDALIFTGGVGENAALIREKVIQPLAHLGFTMNSNLNSKRFAQSCINVSMNSLALFIIQGDEEALIAQQLLAILKQNVSATRVC